MLSKKVLLCSGKIYYDLLAVQQEQKKKDIAIVRIEQLYPYPEQRLAEVMAAYPNIQELVWTQEEPKNQGAWSFVNPLLEDVLIALKHTTTRAKFVGRVATAAPRLPDGR